MHCKTKPESSYTDSNEITSKLVIHYHIKSYLYLLGVKHKVFAGSVLELDALVRDRRLCHGFFKCS